MDALSVIEAMPDSVVAQGDKAVQAYLAQHLPEPATAQAFGWWQTTECVAAITLAAAGAALAAAKILKLKAFIKKAGSVKEAAYFPHPDGQGRGEDQRAGRDARRSGGIHSGH
ncbi:hypothetical protein [Streptomyces violascens]|uniref:hypothetical protein n=1 Tax=Streptomyces violascens TaxID=67381 RepID=UPI0036697464